MEPLSYFWESSGKISSVFRNTLAFSVSLHSFILVSSLALWDDVRCWGLRNPEKSCRCHCTDASRISCHYWLKLFWEAKLNLSETFPLLQELAQWRKDVRVFCRHSCYNRNSTLAKGTLFSLSFLSILMLQ